MVQFASYLAGLALLHYSAAVPFVVPLGATGRSLSISEDGLSASIEGRTINLREAFQQPKACKPQGSPMAGPKAVYFITNAANNSIVALKVASDGTLSDGSITPTGGSGMSGVDSKGAPANPDGLFSQGAVKVVGSKLVAVNPGSNTASLFSIDPSDPTKLTMLGKPANTLGEFPMSIAVSAKLSQACVANGGAKAGIACFDITNKGLVAKDKVQRPLDIKQTTPPAGPLGTISQTFFNTDSTALLTTVKGNPMVNNTGFLSAFPVVNGCVDTKETRSSPAGTAVLFGTALLPNSSNIFVTDASFGSATLSLNSKNIANVSASTKIDGQKATCWATFSDTTGTAFVTDVGVNHLVEVDTVTGAIVKVLNSTNGNLGMIDLIGKGNFIYALAPGNGTVKATVAVFDVSGGRGSVKEIQNFAPKGLTDSAQGMAVC